MRLRPPLTVVPGPPLHLRGGDREIFLFDGTTETWLPDLLARLAAGGCDRAALAIADVPAAEIDTALSRLAEAGLLDDARPPRRPRVTLLGQCPLWPWLARTLGAEFGDDGELTLVHEETSRPSQIAEVNRRMLAARRPWMVVSLQTSWARVGPLFVPGETACWECWRARLHANRAHPEAHRAFEALDRPPGSVSVAAHEAVVAGLVAAEVARFLVEGAPQLAGRVLVLDLATLEVELEPVLVAPYCPACRA